MTAKRTEAGEPAPTPIEETGPTVVGVPHPEPAPPAPEPSPEPQEDALALWERPTVGEAIAEVTRRIDAIPKGRRSTGPGEQYAFRGIDDALSALHPLLGEVGLVILPGRVVREVWETRQTKSGGTLNVARLLVRYTFVGPDGSILDAEAWGEAGDSGDKATQKAHSQSYKTLVFQAFSIPTEASAADEPDLTNEPARPFSQEEQERARAAWEAGRAADSLEKLAGVRRRAVHLLDVPLVLPEDASLVPLSLLFDRLRAELERGAAQ